MWTLVVLETNQIYMWRLNTSNCCKWNKTNQIYVGIISIRNILVNALEQSLYQYYPAIENAKCNKLYQPRNTPSPRRHTFCLFISSVNLSKTSGANVKFYQAINSVPYINITLISVIVSKLTVFNWTQYRDRSFSRKQKQATLCWPLRAQWMIKFSCVI